MAAIEEHESSSRLCQEYSSSWKIIGIKMLGTNSIKTPAFSPVPNSDMAFYFELWYQDSGANNDKTSYFKLIFGKSSGVSYPKTMKMNITVSTHSDQGAVIEKYEHNNVSIDELSSLVITDKILRYYEYNSRTCTHSQPTFHCNNLGITNNLTLKCHFVFYEHLVSPTEYVRDMRLLKNLKHFVNDFNCIYYPDSFLNDIEFKVGDVSLLAHKCILAAHSPVFLKMISSDFLESKTNTIVIKDSSAEIFNCFLNYLYSGEIDDKTWPVVKELYMLADKYDVCALKRECIDVIVSILSIENVCEIIKIAHEYGEEFLKSEVHGFVVKNFLEVASKSEWKELIDSYPIIGYQLMLNFAPKF